MNIKTLTIHAGHNPDGKVGSGAIGNIKESTEARNVLKELIPLAQKECKVYDTTCNNGTSQSDILNKIIAKLVDCLEKCLICRHIRRFAD
ncbi:hypothetical protein [Clostridioides difficile]|uniref:hypothetical protein n=1 Tax=Clostridioides difficile TaxID=1496 RepID=UPI001F2888D6|nr:hypothetical protein [Clostridioides difficile]